MICSRPFRIRVDDKRKMELLFDLLISSQLTLATPQQKMSKINCDHFPHIQVNLLFVLEYFVLFCLFKYHRGLPILESSSLSVLKLS
jgi:hypothetical protein